MANNASRNCTGIMQRTWWWAGQKLESKRKHFSISTLGSPTKPLTHTVGRSKKAINQQWSYQDMKHRNYLKISAFFLIVLSLACSQSLPIASQPYPSGKIVYQSDQFGNFEILAIQISNKRIFRLTNNSANDVSPTYISTTNQIGFVSDKNNGWGLYTMDMSGNNPTEVMSKKETAIDYPNWSPDGKFVTASAVENCKSPQPSCVYDIYTISDDGTSLINLTKT